MDSINITPSGTAAHILFCDADACDRFYNRYPNGMNVRYNGLSASLFVDKGTEVDVVPSMLTGLMEIGASRVVRASGLNLNIGMKHMVNMLSNLKTLKLERIIDAYDGSDVSYSPLPFFSLVSFLLTEKTLVLLFTPGSSYCYFSFLQY